MRVLPFRCVRPAPEVAPEVAALPYDVFDRAEARAYVAGHPLSFLNIDRPETQFPPEQDIYAPEVYAKARELLDARIADGTFVDDRRPCYYLYELTQDGRRQLGVVACCSVAEYEDGTIKRHENTRADKELDRVRHIEATEAQTGPIFLAHRDNAAVTALVQAATLANPLLDFVDREGVRERVWRIARPDALAAFEAAFGSVPCAYIADGHHRAASAIRVARERREARGNEPARDADEDTFLAVLFPASQLEILPYNRVVADTAGLGAEGLVEAARQAGFMVGPTQEEAVVPTEKATMGMYAGGAWRVLTLPEGLVPTNDPVASLDVSLLQDLLLAPALGIDDPRSDPRISFVGGIRGTDELERRAGAEGVAFSMHATSIDELFSVADAGLLMPPKSTWFEPKLRSGLFIHRL